MCGRTRVHPVLLCALYHSLAIVLTYLPAIFVIVQFDPVTVMQVL